MQYTDSRYRARSDDVKSQEFGAFRSRSRAVRPVTLRREEAYLPKNSCLPSAQVLGYVRRESRP